jgi:undecaprenyl diphosphate synthase
MGDKISPILFEMKLLKKLFGFKMNSPQESTLPKHVAIIMDGNGRWANSRNFPRTRGHLEGLRRAEDIMDEAGKMGVKVLTLYTFSTENWSRPAAEVTMLMNMLTEVLNRKITKLKADNVQFKTIGRTDRIPEVLLKAMDRMKEETKNNTGLIINLAFNYGSRLEIVDAIKKIASNVTQGKISLDQISDATVSEALYTHDLPDPDLLIRTSGEQRISNFLLWQLSYAEFYFTETLWPDFHPQEFRKAIEDYQARERRYGRVNAQPG